MAIHCSTLKFRRDRERVGRQKEQRQGGKDKRQSESKRLEDRK